MFLSSAFGPRAHIAPLLARVIVALIFLTAGVLKIGHSDDLASTITAFRLGLPGPAVAFIAVALPPFEVLLGLYVLGGWNLSISSTVAALLLTAFIVVLASVVARGLQVNCGCFGELTKSPATWREVLRDVLFLAPAAYLVWWSYVQKTGPGR